MIGRLSGAILLLSAVVNACSTEKKADAAQPPKMKEGSVAPRPAVVSQPAGEYRQQTVTGGVRLTGTVDFDGSLPHGTRCVFSQWSSYFEREDWQRVRIKLAAAGGDSTKLHTSGHIYSNAILDLLDQVKSDLVVPIHTFHPQDISIRREN